MGRPRKGEELRVQISGRIDSKLAQEIRTIADSLYGNLTGIIEELIALGFEEYKKRNPEIMNLVKKRQNEKFYVETFRQAANNESSEPKKKIVKR